MAEVEKQSLLKSSGVVSVLTLLSRVLGLIRDMVIAYFFGSSPAADAFFLAFRIPNFFRRLFAEGAFSQAFVPVLSEYRTQRTDKEVRNLVSRVSGSLGIILIVITFFGVIGAELVISVFGVGFIYNGEVAKFDLAVDLLRLTFPYLLLISMTAFAGAVLNSFGRFGAPAFTPVLLNLSLILCAVYLGPRLQTPVMALAWAVLIAGVAQLTFNLPFLARQGMLQWPRIGFADEGVKRILVLMVPAMFGVSVGQINLLLDTVLASFLQTGSISWLYYSDRLLELPLALFGITIATVILPSLSRKHASQSSKSFSDTLDWAIRMVCVFGIPASIALVVLSEVLITTLFYQGAMSERDVEMASFSLAAYGVGLLGHMLVKVLAPGYFARQDTSSPVRFGIIAMAANMVLNLLLIWHLKHAGLALATSLSAFINAGLLGAGLWRSGVWQAGAGWLRFLMQLLIANLVMCLLLLWLVPDSKVWFEMLYWQRFTATLVICAGGALVYAASLRLVGFNFRHMVR